MATTYYHHKKYVVLAHDAKFLTKEYARQNSHFAEAEITVPEKTRKEKLMEIAEDFGVVGIFLFMGGWAAVGMKIFG